VSHFLFIASDYKPKPGGIAAYIDNLARGLIQLGNRVRVLAVVPPDDKNRIKFLEDYEEWVSPFPAVCGERPQNWLGNWCVSLLEILRCRLPSTRHLLERTPLFRSSSNSISRFRQILAKEKPDIVIFGHLDLDLYPFALAVLEHRVPFGLIAHDAEVCRRPSRINDMARRGLMLKEAAWIAANSNHTRGLLEMWRMPSDKITIVHPPIAAKAIQESAKSVPRDRRDSYNLITICRLVDNKGIDIVLRALKILDQQGIRCRYVVAGDGVERSRLEMLVDALGIRDRVQFTGLIADETKWSLLHDADVFVMPSRVNLQHQHEGFGLAFIEAAAFGVPGVGSTGGGIPEAVIHGETGLLVPEESPEKLAEALQFLYDNPEKRKQMGRVGMERARSQFSPIAIAAHFQNEVSKRTFKNIETARDREAPRGHERIQGTVRALLGRLSAR